MSKSGLKGVVTINTAHFNSTYLHVKYGSKFLLSSIRQPGQEAIISTWWISHGHLLYSLFICSVLEGDNTKIVEKKVSVL